MDLPLVSVIIPTYDRCDAVVLAIETALEQTWPATAMEIIVVDDGSRDDTAAVLARRFGDRIRYLAKANGGVSSARNVGLAAARGRYLALLDSDDEWLPSKLAQQVRFLETHPDHGMVVTDVVWVDGERVGHRVVQRRDQYGDGGWVLARVMRNPSLVPSSVMLTRGAYQAVGGFDEALPTAEDLDFHLRVAMRYPIGLIEEPLTRAMRGHADGLSQLPRTYQDYVGVMERFVDDHGHRVDAADCDAALLEAYARNIKGLFWQGDVTAALRCAIKGARRTKRLDQAGRFANLGLIVAKGLAMQLRRQVIGT